MKKSRSRTAEKEFLASALAEIGREIAETNLLFNQTTDELLIDACIYKLKYLRLKYAYLMHLARLETQSEYETEKTVIPEQIGHTVFSPIQT